MRQTSNENFTLAARQTSSENFTLAMRQTSNENFTVAVVKLQTKTWLRGRRNEDPIFWESTGIKGTLCQA